ncbi:TetR/AcrR family transcriptional regulator [Mycolicibacterium sp. P9-64]|uniref:TetR/AcrR family transcriptional regulator n=1 Tax=Mycolicibacterium sp. P9-64 TaxID=2024612 RepID=UPI00156396A0|nr:TetR/AcrR family transcriptional regulator [Mycolicibacterium sp. P9-64]
MAAVKKASVNGAPKRERKTRTGRDTVGRERVMQVALQMFLANGYAGTSLKAVADELGVSPPALYWYFPSKEELYGSVIEQSMNDFLEYVRGSITDTDPIFKLSQLVRAHVTWQLQQSEIAQAFDLTMALKGRASDIPESRLAPIRKLEQDYVDDVRAILREGTEAGAFAVDDYVTTGFAIITLCEYVTTWYNANGPLSIPAVANRYEGLVRKMVSAVGSRTAPHDDALADS